jgi:hypothetical protein
MMTSSSVLHSPLGVSRGGGVPDRWGGGGGGRASVDRSAFVRGSGGQIAPGYMLRENPRVAEEDVSGSGMWGAHELRQRQRQVEEEEWRRKKEMKRQATILAEQQQQQQQMREDAGRDGVFAMARGGDASQAPSRRGGRGRSEDRAALDLEGNRDRRRRDPRARVSFGGEEERSWEEEDEDDEDEEAVGNGYRISSVSVGEGRLLEVGDGGDASDGADGRQSWKEASEQLRDVGVGVGSEGWGGYTPALAASTAGASGVDAGGSTAESASGYSGETRLPPIGRTAGSVRRISMPSGDSSVPSQSHRDRDGGTGEWPFVDEEEAMAGMSASGRLALPALLRGPKTPVIFGFT